MKRYSPGKGVAPYPKLWCSSYRKGNLCINLDYCHTLYINIRLLTKKGKGNHITFLFLFLDLLLLHLLSLLFQSRVLFNQ